MQVKEQLIRFPSSLKDVCEEMNLAKQPTVRDFVQRRRSTKYRCDCSSVHKHSTYQKSLFSIKYNFSAVHTTKCPYYQLHQRSWSCSLSAQLLPISRRAVEITFAATFGAGGNSIGTSLRFFGSVARSESPAYQLFDCFPDRCARRIDLLESSGDDRHLDRLAELSKLHRELSLLFHAGRVSASYSDDYGNALLHVSIPSIVYKVVFDY